ncbi:unnamed protein product [Porites evermanni]|uniref:Uncharacterized protein n=1 Tax=Porites evermanni TaxID=104178 RepID=A0ABN8Q8G3_9CNID|nr:unnamed protein product [Porites evermanni]
MLVALATVKGLQIYSYIEDVTQKPMESRHAFCNPKAYCLLETILYYKTVLKLLLENFNMANDSNDHSAFDLQSHRPHWISLVLRQNHIVLRLRR